MYTFAIETLILSLEIKDLIPFYCVIMFLSVCCVVVDILNCIHILLNSNNGVSKLFVYYINIRINTKLTISFNIFKMLSLVYESLSVSFIPLSILETARFIWNRDRNNRILLHWRHTQQMNIQE